MTEDGVEGAVLAVVAVAFCWARYRRGEDALRVLKLAAGGRPRMGELLRSVALGVCSSGTSPVSLMSLNASLDPRLGMPGKTSSTSFLGVRIRLGEPRGLAGRACGEVSK